MGPNKTNNNQRMREASQLNNAGATILSSHGGDGKQALESFRAAMVLLTEAVNDPAVLEQDTTEGVEIQGLSFLDVANPFAEQQWFVCNRAVMFECPTEASIFAAVACVFFNVSLAYHKVGLETCHGAWLKQAANLYQHCASLCQVPEYSALALAAYNNQAVILYSMGCQGDEFHGAMGHVQAVLEFAVTNEHEASSYPASMMLLPGYLGEIHLNALTMKLSTIAATA